MKVYAGTVDPPDIAASVYLSTAVGFAIFVLPGTAIPGQSTVFAWTTATLSNTSNRPIMFWGLLIFN
jgi:hypothetical protein